MYPAFTLLGRPFPTYGLLAVAGILAALLYIGLTARGGRVGRIPAVDVLHLVTLAVVGAVAGAKLLSIITQLPGLVRDWERIVQSPQLLLNLLTHGLVFYGGLLGGLLAVWWYCRRYALPLDDVLAVCTPAIPLFHVFGRVGCFLAGCCWGVPASWGVVFPPGGEAPAGVALFPVQLVEAGYNLVLFVVLAMLARRLRQKWMVFPFYLIGYGVARFVLEFFRGDAARGVFVLSTSQWLSLLVVPCALYYLMRHRRKPA